MRLQPLVSAAHAGAAAAGENQSADFVKIDHERSLQLRIVTRAAGGCHRDP